MAKKKQDPPDTLKDSADDVEPDLIDPDVEIDADLDVDIDPDVEIDADLDVDIDPDADLAAEVDVDAADVVDVDDDDDDDDDDDTNLDELEAEELEMLTEDEAAETIMVDEAAEMRAIRRAEIALDVDPEVATDDEFVCQNCFLVKRTSQLADKRKKICTDCAS